MTKAEILSEAIKLEPHEREDLIEDLRQTIDDTPLSAEQMAELRRRIASREKGESTSIPFDQVMEEMLSKYKPV